MKIRITKTPKSSQGGTPKNFFTDTLMYPNIVYGAKTIGIMNTNDTGTVDADISSSLNPVPKEVANVEAEKGELVVKPGLAALYKVNGKKHSKGGTPLALPENSFVFSDDKDLALSQAEKLLLNIKNASKKNKDNTPAKLLNKQVDPKEYNRLVSILQSKNSDNIAKDTSLMMLDKHQKTIGQMALLQELKKNQEAPEFATPPMPVNTNDLENVMQQQYAAKGGFINVFDENPIDPHTHDKKATRNPVTKEVSNTWNGSKYSKAEWETIAKELGFNGTDNTKFQKYLYSKYQDIVDDAHSTKKGWGMPINGMFDGRLGRRWDYIVGKIRKRNSPGEDHQEDMSNIPDNQHNEDPNIHENIQTSPTSKPSQIPWEGFKFNPNAAELLSIAMPGLNAMMLPTRYDMLTQVYSPNIRLDRVNNDQETADMKESAAIAMREAYANARPQQADAISSSVRSNLINQLRQSNASKNQANTQISNTEEQYNDNKQYQNMMFNAQQVEDTYNKNLLALQRRDEMRVNAMNQVVNNGLMVKKNLDSLSYAATAAALPSVTTMKDASGNPMIFTGKDGKQYTKLGVPIGYNQDRLPTFDPNYGGLDSLLVAQNMQDGSDNMSKIAEDYRKVFPGINEDKLAELITRNIVGKQIQKSGKFSNPFGFLNNLLPQQQ